MDINNLIVSTYSLEETRKILDKFKRLDFDISEMNGNSYTKSNEIFITYYGTQDGSITCKVNSSKKIKEYGLGIMTFQEFMEYGENIKYPKKKLIL